MFRVIARGTVFVWRTSEEVFTPEPTGTARPTKRFQVLTSRGYLSIGREQRLAGAQTSFSDSITESTTLADSLANTLTAVGSNTESITAGDDYGNAVVFPNVLNESATAADAFAAANTLNATVDESATLADSYADELIAAGTFNEAITETLTGADSYATAYTANPGYAEVLGALDAYAVEGGIEVVTRRDQGAGKSRKRYKKRLVVEIDGQDFVVSSSAEAEELLAKAQETAKEILVDVRVAAVKGKKVEAPKAPRIRAKGEGPELQELVSMVSETRQAIKDLYALARSAEIAYLMRKAEDDDEDDAITVLLH